MNNVRNQVQLIGNVGKDVDYRTTSNGSSVAKFSLATHDYYKNNKGEKVKETQWHNVVLWGKQAELANEMVAKGSPLLVTGKIMYRTYDDDAGNRKYICEIKGNGFTMLGKKEKVEAPF